MSVQLRPEYDAPFPDGGWGSDGKLLYWALDTLDRVAEAAGVRPLSAYLDPRPEPTDLEDWDDFEAGVEEWRASRVDWHPAGDGVQTVEGLLAALRRGGPLRLKGQLAGRPDGAELAASLPAVLEPAAAALRRAEAAGVRFRLDLT
jgi:hypothetical protein